MFIYSTYIHLFKSFIQVYPKWNPTRFGYALPTVSSLRSHCLKAEGLKIQFAIR